MDSSFRKETTVDFGGLRAVDTADVQVDQGEIVVLRLTKVGDSGGCFFNAYRRENDDAAEELKSWYRRRGFHETGKREFKHLPFVVCFMEKNLN